MQLASALSGQAVIGAPTATLKLKTGRKAIRQHISATVQEAPASKKELRKPRTENVDAENGFYVDHTCIGTALSRL